MKRNFNQRNSQDPENQQVNLTAAQDKDVKQFFQSLSNKTEQKKCEMISQLKFDFLNDENIENAYQKAMDRYGAEKNFQALNKFFQNTKKIIFKQYQIDFGLNEIKDLLKGCFIYIKVKKQLLQNKDNDWENLIKPKVLDQNYFPYDQLQDFPDNGCQHIKRIKEIFKILYDENEFNIDYIEDNEYEIEINQKFKETKVKNKMEFQQICWEVVKSNGNIESLFKFLDPSTDQIQEINEVMNDIQEQSIPLIDENDEEIQKAHAILNNFRQNFVQNEKKQVQILQDILPIQYKKLNIKDKILIIE